MRLFYDSLIKIKRFKATTGNKKSYVATATADASIQALGKEGGQLDQGMFGSTFVAYVEVDTPVQKGDRVTDENDVVYSVTDVVVRDTGSIPFKEIIIKTN